MYVKWKLLLSFGTIFWILLCMYDIYFIDPVTRFYYADSDEYGWLATVSEDEINSEPVVTNMIEDITFAEDKYSYGECLLFWNVVIFLTTVMFCIGSKLATNHLWPKNKTKEIFHNETNKTNSTSKIPVFSMVSKSVTDMLESADALKSITNLSVASTKGDVTSKYMDKQCAKLRDNMIAIQSASLKEHGLTSKKLEMALREKRELCKKLNVINKESSSARQHVEQLLSEKCSLLERLESASKDFRQNIKSKKTALAKLEESQANVALLMKEVEKYRNEKNELENKFKKSDLENQRLKELVNYYENGLAEVKNFVAEQEMPFNNLHQESIKMKNEENLSQSHKDVQRVQKRLNELEISLDKLKYTNWSQEESKKRKIECNAENQAEPQVTDHKTPTFLESPHKACKLLYDNLTDEQRQKILVPGDCELSPDSTKNVDYDFHCDPDFERSDINTVKQFNHNFLRDVISEEITNVIEEEDTDDCDSQNRMISNSPAFQRFLHKMDKDDKRQAKFAIPTNMF